jgi:hypothetical protein
MNGFDEVVDFLVVGSGGGSMCAGLMGRAYPGPGSSVGPSFVWGYVAAKRAVGAS